MSRATLVVSTCANLNWIQLTVPVL